jgi:hypothetical protein
MGDTAGGYGIAMLAVGVAEGSHDFKSVGRSMEKERKDTNDVKERNDDRASDPPQGEAISSLMRWRLAHCASMFYSKGLFNPYWWAASNTPGVFHLTIQHADDRPALSAQTFRENLALTTLQIITTTSYAVTTVN